MTTQPKLAPASPSERRNHSRHVAAGLATIEWRAFTGESCRDQARIREVSAAGASIRLYEPIVVGQNVRLRLETGEYAASVRSCRNMGRGFLIGMQLSGRDGQLECWRSRWLEAQSLEL
jgi:hypothetical protein